MPKTMNLRRLEYGLNRNMRLRKVRRCRHPVILEARNVKGRIKDGHFVGAVRFIRGGRQMKYLKRGVVSYARVQFCRDCDKVVEAVKAE